MKRLVLVFLFACNTTSSTPPTPPASSSPPPPSPQPSAQASSQATPGACTKDADCATYSSYCNDLPCACVPYLTSAGAPKCSTPSSVRCLVDPCQRKTAACQEGKCVITVASTPAQ